MNPHTTYHRLEVESLYEEWKVIIEGKDIEDDDN